MHRAWDDAIALAFLDFAQIDQSNILIAKRGLGILGAESPSAIGDDLLRQADAHIGGDGNVHHLGVG